MKMLMKKYVISDLQRTALYTELVIEKTKRKQYDDLLQIGGFLWLITTLFVSFVFFAITNSSVSMLSTAFVSFIVFSFVSTFYMFYKGQELIKFGKSRYQMIKENDPYDVFVQIVNEENG